MMRIMGLHGEQLVCVCVNQDMDFVIYKVCLTSCKS